MLDVDFTARAKRDLRDIKSYTTKLFGQNQADLYLDTIQLTISTIRSHPNIGEPVLVREPYRCFEVEKHRIFYQQMNEVIVIYGILHQRQLPFLHLTGHLE